MTHTNRSPEMQAGTPAKPQAPFTRQEPRAPTTAGFEEKRESLGDEDAGNLMQRLDSRLAKGRNVVFERSVDDRLMDELLKGNAAGPEAGQLLKDPDRFNSLRAEGVTQGVKIAGIPALQKLSDAYKTALFVNPLPHMFNIARLTYLAGGPSAVLKGIQHFAAGGPAGELRQRLETHTGLPEYLSGAAPKFADKIPGVQALRQYGQGKLSSFDASMRAGYLQELDNAVGKGADRSVQEYQKGREVSNAIGGYDETSPVVEAIRAAGGPFAQWRLGIVPRAVGTAALRAPHRVERYARGAQTFNQDTGQNIQFGGPEEDMGRLIGGPSSAARYLTSPSTIGAVPAGIIGAAGSNRKADVASAAEDLARQYVPGAGIAEELMHTSPYAEGPSTAENTALGLVGGYSSEHLSPAEKRQQAAIDKAATAQIRGAMAKGDFRSAWDAYYRQKMAIRALQMQAH